MSEVKMSDQQVLDIVVRGIREQGGGAVGAQGSCQYRAPNGRKCAAGLLIDDKDYKVALEGDICTTFEVREILSKKVESVDFVRQLQIIHDDSFSSYERPAATADDLPYWEKRMRVFAQDYGLTYPD